jgi:pimeloyl-ACP methyl ester carboxylesterase
MNERTFLAQLEAANADELSQILRRPSAEEQRVLEIYFGTARLERLRSLALGSQRRGTPRGNVVVLHGIMGGELTVFPPRKSSQYIWMSIPRLAIGGVGWLRMTPEPRSQFDVRATGILKKWYSEMLLGLAADQWNVRAFCYDWRLDLADCADALRAQIDAWFGPSAPVHLVAHSMGGLVSRTYILRHPQRWAKGGKLIMLGTPNHGSFAIPQVITGALDTIRKLALVDLTHRRADLLGILNSLPGSLQMLPSPLVMKTMEPMYDEQTWSGYGVTQKLLDRARQSHERLAPIADRNRMSYIAGCNQATKSDVASWQRLDDPRGYKDSLEGDGTVPHLLGFLNDGAKRIPTYFVECEHGALPNHAGVIAATQQLLVGAPCTLPQQPPKSRGLPNAAAQSAARIVREQREEAQLRELAQRVRGRTRGARVEDAPLSGDEIQAGALLVRSFLAASPAEPVESTRTPGTPPKRAAIRVRLALRGLQETVAGTPPVDAISVGQYANVAPQNAELALDRAISKGGELLITALHRRGVVSGVLGQNFQLTDPRDPARIIVLAGMGQPGTFREAELAVLTRELVWMLGRSGRRHLQTVAIGAGAGNLRAADAMRAWLRGIRRALFDAAAAGDPQLHTITFVEYSAANFLRLHYALLAEKKVFADDPEPLDIDYTAPDQKTFSAAKRAAHAEARRQGVRELQKSLDASAPAADVEPVRLTIRLLRDSFEFAALTADASVPQRDTQIDPQLIDEANDQLPEAAAFSAQLDHGHLLGRLLIPEDFRDQVVRPGVPLVVTVDATTARVHWEMVALNPANQTTTFAPQSFLGTACGLTRQLRTSFAPLPEPPLLTGRPLRVLVIADPAGDAPLPGAQEEGEAVAAIFEEFGRTQPVEVVRLFGPGEATRVAVLDQLINHRFDVLHYAGHCFFNADDPPSSGWLFNRDPQHVLTAHELSRIDRIPRFVFSNACESGITPDRAAERNALLAPSFAEAFFARGVSNFICTAWPVDDVAALAFARRVYRGVLGTRGPGLPPESAHVAMTAARLEIAALGAGGMQTWGAYQHYGDPNFRIVAPAPRK